MVLNLREVIHRETSQESTFEEEIIFSRFNIPEISVTDVEASIPDPGRARRPSIRRRMTVVSREGGLSRDGGNSGHDKVGAPRINMNLEHDTRIVLPSITEDLDI